MKPRLKHIHLVLQNDEWNYANELGKKGANSGSTNNSASNGGVNSSGSSSTTTSNPNPTASQPRSSNPDGQSNIRLIYVQTKFVINNKTSLDLAVQVDDHFLVNAQNKKKQRFINSRQLVIKSNGGFQSTADVVNVKHMFMNEMRKQAADTGSLLLEQQNQDETSLIQNDDLFYLNVKEVSFFLGNLA